MGILNICPNWFYLKFILFLRTKQNALEIRLPFPIIYESLSHQAPVTYICSYPLFNYDFQQI